MADKVYLPAQNVRRGKAGYKNLGKDYEVVGAEEIAKRNRAADERAGVIVNTEPVDQPRGRTRGT